MKQTTLLILLLSLLTIEGVVLVGGNSTSTISSMDWRIAFFILIPLGLALLVWFQFRWAAMACVMYATVGLAMDVATMVQTLTSDSDVGGSLILSGTSGLLNFFLIVFGGRSFLDVGQGLMPPKSRSPSPPSPS